MEPAAWPARAGHPVLSSQGGTSAAQYASQQCYAFGMRHSTAARGSPRQRNSPSPQPAGSRDALLFREVAPGTSNGWQPQLPPVVETHAASD